jgi:hypothetical protein
MFYLSGFDPKGPAHYHRLFAEQAALAARVGGYEVEVGARRRASEHTAGWTVSWQPATTDGIVDPEAVVHTEVEFMRWDDIVREHWPREPLVLARDLVETSALYLRTGALWKMLQLSWPPVVALVTPLLLLIALIACLPLALAIGCWVGARSGSWAAGAAVGLSLFAVACGLAWLAERRMNMRWLLRSYAFTGRQGTQGWPQLEDRLDRLAQRIVQRMSEAAADLSQPIDELLVVAHSSGSIMACSVLARALALDPQLTQRGARVSLMTLGQWNPLLSSLPSAHRFRAELTRLGAEPALDWVDFTAPPDGCCFALTDPLAAAGIASTRPDHPKLLSPRFAALFTPATYRKIRSDRFQLHFQYLMASELPGDYDYTAITSGPLTLGARFGAHASITDFRQFRLFATNH